MGIFRRAKTDDRPAFTDAVLHDRTSPPSGARLEEPEMLLSDLTLIMESLIEMPSRPW